MCKGIWEEAGKLHKTQSKDLDFSMGFDGQTFTMSPSEPDHISPVEPIIATEPDQY